MKNMNKTFALKKLEQEISKKLNCELKKDANLVFGKGNPDAKIMFIGEAPGKKEDEKKEPFVGRAGTELNKCLEHINLTLNDVYIANILKYRPPKNRNPTKQEIIIHAPYLIKQIEIIQPKIICPLGNFATKFVLANFNVKEMNKIQGISKIRAKQQTIRNYEVYPLYHPAATIYNSKLKETQKKDFEKLKLIL